MTVRFFLLSEYQYINTSTRFLYYFSVYVNLFKELFLFAYKNVRSRKRMQRYNYFPQYQIFFRKRFKNLKGFRVSLQKRGITHSFQPNKAPYTYLRIFYITKEVMHESCTIIEKSSISTIKKKKSFYYIYKV